MVGVTGSIPVAPTTIEFKASMAGAFPCSRSEFNAWGVAQAF